MSRRLSLKKGFTIVELLVVIVVIGILVTLVLVGYNGISNKAVNDSVASDLDNTDTAETNYSLQHAGAGKAWYSGDITTDSDLAVTPSSGNIIDVVTNSTDYCIRIYNPKASTYNTLATALTKESSTGVCAALPASADAGGTGPTASLVAWWQLDGSATDSSGNGNNGTPLNVTGTIGQNGLTNQAYSFNGISSEVDVADNATIGPTSRITVSAWVNASTIPSSTIAGIVSKDVSSGTSNPPYDLEIYTNGKFAFKTDNAANVSASVICNEVVPTVGTWYFVVGTFDGIHLNIYVNGTPCSATATQTDLADTTGLLRIGQQKTTYNRWFSGTIDDVRIYNQALSSTAIQSLYAAGAQ